MRKLSQPALFAEPQFESPVGALTCPVQVTLGLPSETVPDTGLAPRVIGMTTTTAVATNKQSSAARAYLERMMVETLRAFAGLLNISESPFVATGNQSLSSREPFSFKWRYYRLSYLQ